jgi:hypothetical protein
MSGVAAKVQVLVVAVTRTLLYIKPVLVVSAPACQQMDSKLRE